MRTTLFLASLTLALIGCGGGGHEEASASAFAGSFTGSFAYQVKGQLPSDTIFTGPSAGVASGTVVADGTVTLNVGDDVLYGSVGRSRKTGSGQILVKDRKGVGGVYYPATFSFARAGDSTAVTIDATIPAADNTGVQVDYTVALRPQD